MRFFRPLLIMLLLAVALGAPASTKDKVLFQSSFPGTIVGVESADYVHLLVKDSAGKTRFFFIGSADGLLKQIVDDPGAFKGRKVKVTWQKVTTHIPEAGGDMTIERVTKVEPR